MKVYTLGTSTRTFEEFVEILRTLRLTQLADVRSYPTSRRFPQFNRQSLEPSLESAGVHYVYLGGELGGYRKGGYEAHMGTDEYQEGIERLSCLAMERPTVIVCAEILPWKCHRRYIAHDLESRGFEVIHVLQKDRVWVPREPGFGAPTGAP